MYPLIVILLLFVLPGVCVGVEALDHGFTLLLIGKWICFWGVGVRLFLAGVRQVLQPAFTAQEIFDLTDGRAFPLVREIGFGNLSMGVVGLCVLSRPSWLLPAALVGCITVSRESGMYLPSIGTERGSGHGL